MLKNKTVVLGITASIAAYKAAGIVSLLKKQNADVYVIMTDNAAKIISPATFDSLTGHRTMVDMFDRNHEFSIAHIALADTTDVFCIAPATANIIGKLACGIADDMLSTTALAMTCPIIISPAMNTKMFNNPVVQENIQTLKKRGMTVIEPDCGRLACGATGQGKLPSEELIVEYILKEAAKNKDLAGIRVLVTAGPTREAIDPVRFITNHSGGKMGYAIAERAMLRGADVTLISGPTAIKTPHFVNVKNVVSAREMFDEVAKESINSDIIIMAAAVADYTPKNMSDEKIKKQDGDLQISLKRTDDILKWLGENKTPSQIICGFSMESENLIKNSKKKLKAKNADLIAANSLRESGAGFMEDTNHLTLIEENALTDVPMMSKPDAADILLDRLLEMYSERTGI